MGTTRHLPLITLTPTIMYLPTLSSLLFLATLIQSGISGPTTECLDNSDTEGSITNSCLGCICEASTRCDVFTGCVANGALCGPFLISKGFWIDSGRCVLEGDDPNSDQSLLRCTNDLKCSSRIVRSHSNAFAQDCNGDGLVTCDDYAMMHRNGGYECSNPLAGTDYWQIYEECKEMVISQGANI